MSWISFFNWILFIGLVFSAVGGIGVFFTQKSIDKKREGALSSIQEKVENVRSDRILSDSQKKYIEESLKTFKVNSLAIHYEADPETTSYIEKISVFLETNGYIVYKIPHMMAGFAKGDLEIKMIPPNQETAYLYVGSQ